MAIREHDHQTEVSVSITVTGGLGDNELSLAQLQITGSGIAADEGVALSDDAITQLKDGPLADLLGDYFDLIEAIDGIGNPNDPLTPPEIAAAYNYTQWISNEAEYNQVMTTYYAQCGLSWDSDIGLPDLSDNNTSVDTENLATQDTVVLIFRNPYDMEYTLRISKGELSEIVENIEIENTERINVEGALEASTTYPIDEIISAEWEGSLYDIDGNDITSPDVVHVDGNTIEFVTSVSKVVGTLLIKYKTTADITVASIPGVKEDENEQDAALVYNATVRAFYEGATTSLELTANTDADKCNYKMNFNVVSPDDDDYGVIFVVYDYCTGEDITDKATVRVDGSVVDAAGTRLGPGDYSLRVTAPGYLDSIDDKLANDTLTITPESEEGQNIG